MGLFPRLRASLATLFGSAEDPRAASRSVYQRQAELLERLEHAVVELRATRTQLEAQAERIRQRLPGLRQQAGTALVAGREPAARAVLKRLREAAVEAGRLDHHAAEVRQEEERLVVASQGITAQMAAFRTRQEVLSARYTAAEAQVRSNEALAGLSGDMTDLDSVLDEAEARTESMQARAFAIDDLMSAGVLGGSAAGDDVLDADEERAVERDLEDLRRDCDVAPPARRAAAGGDPDALGDLPG
jgi:phage shock protein A